MPLRLRVNRQDHTLDLPPDTPLLALLRNDLGLNGPKYGCGLGQCGACTILIDGRAARPCTLPAAAAQGHGTTGHAITTLEGLGTPDHPHPVQAAFIAEQAAQCGYCLNGMILTATAFLAHTPSPTDAAIRHALRFNLCRCGAHEQILRAVRRAARAVP